MLPLGTASSLPSVVVHSVSAQPQSSDETLSVDVCRTKLHDQGIRCTEPCRFGTFVADARHLDDDALQQAVRTAKACEGAKCNILLPSALSDVPLGYRYYCQVKENVNFDKNKLPRDFISKRTDGMVCVPVDSKAPPLFESSNGLFKKAANLLIKVKVEGISKDFIRLLKNKPLLTDQDYNAFVNSGKQVAGTQSVDLILAGVSSKTGDTNELYCDTVSRPGGTAEPTMGGLPESFKQISLRETKEELGVAVSNLLDQEACWTHVAKSSTYNTELGNGVNVPGIRDDLSASIVNINNVLKGPDAVLSLISNFAGNEEFRKVCFIRPNERSEDIQDWAKSFGLPKNKTWAAAGFGYQIFAEPYNAKINEHVKMQIASLMDGGSEIATEQISVSSRFDNFCKKNEIDEATGNNLKRPYFEGFHYSAVGLYDQSRAPQDRNKLRNIIQDASQEYKKEVNQWGNLWVPPPPRKSEHAIGVPPQTRA